MSQSPDFCIIQGVMNVFVAIMLIFAAAGFVDKALEGRFGLSQSFDRGLGIMGAMAIPVVSICTVGLEFIHRHMDTVAGLSDRLFFDPSTIIGAILPPDFGGYFLVRELAGSPELVVLNGVILGTVLGQATSFQIPVFLAGTEREDHPAILRGFIAAMVVVPVGLLAAEAFIRMPAGLFLRQFIPVFVLCMIITAGLYRAPKMTARIFAVFARIVNCLFYVMFAVAVVGLFIPSLAYSKPEAMGEAVIILFKCAVVAAGALVMSELILKLFRAQIHRIAERMGINEVAAVSLLMTCATSLAILPLYPRMDPKGKEIAAAVSLSGAYVFGGSMAFVSNVTDGATVALFVFVKILCAVLSGLIVHRLYSKKTAAEEGGSL